MKNLVTLVAALCVVLSSQAQLNAVVHEVVYTDDGTIAAYPSGASTYRIYAELNDGTDALTAVYAEAGSELTLGTESDVIWNTTFGGITGTDLNPAFFPVVPESEWDSMVTIGRANSGEAGVGITAVSVLPNNTVIGDSFGGAVAGPDLVMQDGTWFSTPDGVNTNGQSANFRVLLAQITTTQDLEYNLNIQVIDGGIGGTEIKYVWDPASVDSAEEVDGSSLGLSYAPSVDVNGCTDAAACNYNSAATVDDSSCVFAVGCDTCSGETDGSGVVVDNPEVGESCDDGDAGTFMDTVQADCSCAGVTIVDGCTDMAACNYNAAANNDDSSCVFATGCDTCSGETDGTGVVVDNPEVGEACDDGDAATVGDTVQADCSCAGIDPSLPQSQLDYAAGEYDLCDLIKADWVFADDYRFVFTPQPSGMVIQVEQGGPNTFLQLTNVMGLEVGTTYGVTVDALFGATWSVGTVSTDVTITAPTPFVNPSDECDAHGPHALGDYISAKPYVCGGDKWEWTFTADGQLPVVYTRNSANRFIRLSNVGGLLPGTQYDVTVRAGYPNGAFTPMSEVGCIAIIGVAPGGIAAGGPTVDADADLERTAEGTAAVAFYPNPNTGDFLNVNLMGVESPKVTLDIVNMMGANVKRIELNVAGGNVNEVISLDGLASGVYLVNTNMNGEVFTERLIIQK